MSDSQGWIDDHPFTPVAGHPDDDECTFEGCGEPELEHEWTLR